MSNFGVDWLGGGEGEEMGVTKWHKEKIWEQAKSVYTQITNLIVNFSLRCVDASFLSLSLVLPYSLVVFNSEGSLSLLMTILGIIY